MTEKQTILVVEDEQALASVIKAKLELLGCQTVTARTVDQALAYLQDVPTIAAVWLDHYLLGEENGLDLVVRMKETPQWQSLPIFVVSNTASPDKQLSYIHLGIDKYFVKAEHTLEEITKAVLSSLQK